MRALQAFFLCLGLLAIPAKCLLLESRRQALQHSAAQIASLSTLLALDSTTTPITVPSDPYLSLPNGLSIPRVGYSLYKTPEDQVIDGVKLALAAGVRHFDVGSQYGTNSIVGEALQDYIRKGSSTLKEGEQQQQPLLTRQQRKQRLFVTHKLSNEEQSTSKQQVMQAVQKQRSMLKLDAIDLVMIHSPLTNSLKRLTTYEALLELQSKGVIKSVGVANYGLGPLQEIVTTASLPAPAVIQLVLSPFNQHRDVVEWANKHSAILSCSAWSKLSSGEGPQKGWSVLADIAKQRNMTKAQVLVRWAVQNNYLCVPRSSAKYKIERQAIYENSWEGTRSFVLTEQEMAVLNGLDEQLPAGRLGIIDGWNVDEIVNDQWDPTLIV